MSSQRGGIGSLREDENDQLSHEFSQFQKPLIDDTIQSGYTLEHSTTQNLNENNVIEIVVPPSEHYIKLNEIYLKGEFQVVKKKMTDGTEEKLTAQDDVSICNLAPSALFKLVTLHMNNTECNDRSGYHYPWKAFIETMFNFTEENKDNYLKTFSCYIPDDAGKEDGPDFMKKEGGNSGYVKRAELIAKSEKVEFYTKVHLDVLTTNRLLLNGIQLKFSFHRNSDNDILISPTDPTTHTLKIKLSNLKLMVPYVQVSKEKSDQDGTALMKESALYPFPLLKCQTHNIPLGTSGLLSQTLATGVLPNLILVGFVQGKKMENLKHNPFYFNHEKINRCFFRVNGRIVNPVMEQIDFDKEKYKGLYFHLVKTLQLDDPTHPIKFTEESFKSGCTFFALDTRGCCGGMRLHRPLMGQLDINLSFSETPGDSLSLVSFQIYNAGVSINKDREVTFMSSI